jgi:hypothetical protein
MSPLEFSYSSSLTKSENQIPSWSGRWEKCEIPPRLRDLQAEWESPAVGLFHAAAFSTALLPTNSATQPGIFLPGAPLHADNTVLYPGAGKNKILSSLAASALSAPKTPLTLTQSPVQ